MSLLIIVVLLCVSIFLKHLTTEKNFIQPFLLESSCFILCQFLLSSKINQLCMYIHSFLWGLPSCSGYHSALSRVLCARQYVRISYLFYTKCQQCMCVNPSLPVPPIFPPTRYPYICSQCLCFLDVAIIERDLLTFLTIVVNLSVFPVVLLTFICFKSILLETYKF